MWNIVGDIFSDFATQILWGLGVLVLFGVLLDRAGKVFLSNTGKGGLTFMRCTGVIGTPIHELSHAIMCLLFGHRIVKICLFEPDSKSGTLGYVEHAYQKDNWYHRAGNFWIGIAPMLGGSAVMILLMHLLLPEAFAAFRAGTEVLCGGFSPFEPETYRLLWVCVKSLLAAFFSPSAMLSWQWWVFLVVALMIAMHLDISPADMRTAATGFWVFALLLLVADTALYFVGLVLEQDLLGAVTGFSMMATNYILVMILPATLITLIALLFSFLFAKR